MLISHICFRESSSDSEESDEVVQPGLPQHHLRRQDQARHRRHVQHSVQDEPSSSDGKVGRRWSRRLNNCNY